MCRPGAAVQRLSFVVVLLAGLACSGGDEPSRDPTDPDPAGAGGGAGGAGGGRAGARDAGPRAVDAPASTDAPTSGGRGDAGTTLPPPGSVVITEVMYHPVLEPADGDLHEFVEIYNAGASEISLRGWKLGGDVSFTFPERGLKPKEHLVVAKSRDALLAVSAYRLVPTAVVGDYGGALDNGSGRVTLADAAGEVVDAIAYKDSFPWPLSADALGASARWLPPELLPLTKHEHRGRSLQRLDVTVSAAEIANWDVSAEEGATPGRANSVSGAPRPIALALAVTPAGGAGKVRAGAPVTIDVTFSALGAVSGPKIEYFVDDPEITTEAPQAVPLSGAGKRLTAMLPAQKDLSIVRYRIVGDRGRGAAEVISPRPTDPQGWHAYFVEPESAAASRTYHLFVSRKDWGTLWDNLQEGHIVGCKEPYAVPCRTTTCACGADKCRVSAKWNATVPAVFVYDGKVYDVQARYQGSRHNRHAGDETITEANWPAAARPTPTTPMPSLQALSWSLDFPRYAPLEGRSEITLTKRSCNAIEAYLGAKLYNAAGIPFFSPRLVRFFVNGRYYHYALEWIESEEQLFEKLEGGKPVGDFFESKGYVRDEGPFGVGKLQPLEPYCGYDKAARYAATYARKTNEGRSNDELVALVEGLEAARAKGTPALKAFLTERFDVEALVTYVAIRNWSGAWDDHFHNFFLYRRSDGKWMMTPWDLDEEFGLFAKLISPIFNKPEGTFYVGSRAAAAAPNADVMRDARDQPLWNGLKDAVLVALRAEFNAKVTALAAKELSAEAIGRLADEAGAIFKVADARDAASWKSAGSGGFCNVGARVAAIKEYATKRNARIPAGLTAAP